MQLLKRLIIIDSLLASAKFSDYFALGIIVSM